VTVVAIVIVRGDNWETTFRGNEIQLIRDDIGGFQITDIIVRVRVAFVFCTANLSTMHTPLRKTFYRAKKE